MDEDFRALMDRVILLRGESGDQGTFGRLLLRGAPFCYTGELPDRGNRPNISNILPGLYKCGLVFSPHFRRNLYLIGGTRGRLGCEVHPANLMGDIALGYKSQLNGCVALGEKLGWMDGQKAVLLSQPAVRRFMNLMGGQPFYLEVKNEFSI